MFDPKISVNKVTIDLIKVIYSDINRLYFLYAVNLILIAYILFFRL
jgi:hypothetical protein